MALFLRLLWGATIGLCVSVEPNRGGTSRARALIFSSSLLNKAHIFSLLLKPVALPIPQLEMHRDILLLKDLMKLSRLLFSEESLEKSLAKLFQAKSLFSKMYKLGPGLRARA